MSVVVLRETVVSVLRRARNTSAPESAVACTLSVTRPSMRPNTVCCACAATADVNEKTSAVAHDHSDADLCCTVMRRRYEALLRGASVGFGPPPPAKRLLQRTWRT